MNLRVMRTVSAIAFPSLPAPAGKEKDVETDGCRTAAVSLSLDGSTETVALEEETKVDASVGGCFWMASGAPPVVPPAVAATELVVVGGF